MLQALRSVYTVVILSLSTFALMAWFALGPWPHDSWLRSSEGNSDHALSLLLNASMLQAADSCGEGHFGPDESYGYWVQDFQFVLNSAHPASKFAILARRPEAMAGLYGLIGLRLTHPGLAAVIDSEREWPDTLVLVSNACTISKRRLRDVLHEILAGLWDSRLTRIRVDVH